ncbi:Ig-like domain-containing protein [Pyxidicoccus xibeiensis]|uniref:Ig-like domain-containing protein n=1 Tax=Pyxidicoccus xibeiensis TaxID=2906759 RepID=UPI0020A7AEB4|nr:hypothetical protein [Pyxidicoccus xibeiensis]MCP3136631.1 hypothetical protein [Pyxidicoccus xibeiensis]
MPLRIQPWLASLLLVVTALMGSACGDDNEPMPPANKPPSLTGPTVSDAQAAPGDVLTLTLAATDPEGDTLSYAWAQAPASPAGTFSSTTVASPTWTAPATGGTFTLQVTVSDGKGGSVQGSVDVNVQQQQQQNRPPTVAATITAPASLLAGTTGTFSITASDADGDALTYAWEQTSPATQGTWVGARTGSSAQWYSPAVGTQTTFTVSVSVTDGQSAPVVRTVTVPVTVPRYTADIQPVWTSTPCTGCHGASGGLSLAAASSYSNLVNVNANNAACNTLKRVTPGAPDDSVLVRKLEGTACGNRMPRNNATYFDNNPGLIVRVRSWILAGAAND